MVAKHEKIRVLLVEDEYFLAQTIEMRLKALGYDCLPAEDGVEALEMVAKNLPDVILMDAMMPRMDGFECTKKLKADDRTKKIPVIFLTARALPEDRKKAFAAGADDYLTKPFEAEDLLETIKKWTPSRS